MNGNEFLLNTDYGIDKILGSYSGNFLALQRFAAFQPRLSAFPIEHDFGTWGLIVGAYSFDNIVWYPFGVNSAEIGSGNPVFQTVEVSAYCDNANIVVQASNYLTSNRTIYFALNVLSRD